MGASVDIDSAANMNRFKTGQRYAANLIFKMDSFVLHIPMHLLVRSVNDIDRKIGVAFVEMTPRQLSVMQQLVSAYISGELTSIEDIIHVVERNNFVKPRSIPTPQKTSPVQQAMRLLRKVLIFGLGALIFAYLLLSLYERNFIVSATNAYVDASSFMVNTPTGGTVFFHEVDQGDAVKEGAPLATIQSRTGKITTLESPCNCTFNQPLVADGALVNEGESLLRLAPSGATMYVTAYLPYEEAADIHEGQDAQVALSGSDIRLRGTIDYISSMAVEENNLYRIRIVFDEAIDTSLLGTPAHVTIDTLY